MASESEDPHTPMAMNENDEEEGEDKTINLESCPSIFVLPTHLTLDELHDVEEMLTRCSAALTYDIAEAKLVLGKISQKKRAALELRARGLWTEEILSSLDDAAQEPPPLKRRKVDGGGSDVHTAPTSEPQVVDLSMESEDEDGEMAASDEGRVKKKVLKPSKQQSATEPFFFFDGPEDGVKVVKLEWLNESITAGHALPIAPFTVYHARKTARPQTPKYERTTSAMSSQFPSAQTTPQSPSRKRDGASIGILERARADAFSTTPQPSQTTTPFAATARVRRTGLVQAASPSQPFRPKLYRETTDEHEAAENLPEAPDWVRNNLGYACQRSAFLHPPNEAFITQLVKIRTIRELTLDEIGVRAYSTSIAAIAAYPYLFQSPAEVLSLPGCETKIANLYTEWKQSPDGTVGSAKQLEMDPVLKTLDLFNNIWGVGAKSARDFHYRNQWRSLDDIVEQGWHSLSRVQQIGVKYYDEFLSGIPREEVQSIAEVILEHAKRVRPGSEYDGKGVECIIVGGYRRGKQRCGDVDVILTHRDENVTFNLVYDIVASLEEDSWITHTLSLHLTNSLREQQTLPYRGEDDGKPRFDSLDKALVVWQSPYFDDPEALSSEDEDEDEDTTTEDGDGGGGGGGGGGDDDDDDDDNPNDNPDAIKIDNPPKHKSKKKPSTPHTPKTSSSRRKNNPNPHRRVDIIISPWRTIGCAVLGWSGDTTFERDLRRYAKKVHNWKFDSSGVRERAGSGGRVVDLEGKGETWEERERLVMEGLGVGWRPAVERCTR
ncbi:hypothetical protein AJ80_09274 [Polytolypa hystricis UAMH7299]|uniref:BRCT domain-containing protein n=1 Tax=Polytolypa hystricis (strain UAMH7299) TaxID=1447883 RepID=A0A2B7WTJ6_POLH7|nr:hypothetical protein AJ80_09274 [Polytolypa hystricis UAMH7299]